MNLHSIRFCPFFLRFCFSMKKYALFCLHFYQSISALSRLLHFDKKFVQKFCVWVMRAIFKIGLYPFTKNFFCEGYKLLSSIRQYVTVCWLVRIRTYKNADEKEHTFSGEEKPYKNGQLERKYGYCVNPPKVIFSACIFAKPSLSVDRKCVLLKLDFGRVDIVDQYRSVVE